MKVFALVGLLALAACAQQAPLTPEEMAYVRDIGPRNFAEAEQYDRQTGYAAWQVGYDNLMNKCNALGGKPGFNDCLHELMQYPSMPAKSALATGTGVDAILNAQRQIDYHDAAMEINRDHNW